MIFFLLKGNHFKTLMYQVIILGAGFSGLCLAAKLLQANYTNILILEKEESIGGTWLHNNYPGSECDIESHLYSYSFFRLLSNDTEVPPRRGESVLLSSSSCGSSYK